MDKAAGLINILKVNRDNGRIVFYYFAIIKTQEILR
jgi:hypothetical protein